MPELRVARLSTTAIKGLLMQHPEAIDLTADGAVGDRLYYLIDETGSLKNSTRTPELFGLSATYDSAERKLSVVRGEQVLCSGVIEEGDFEKADFYGLRTVDSHRVSDPVWSEFFSDIIGTQVRLLKAQGPAAYDVTSTTLLGTATIAELARQAGLDEVDGRRFRMLIEFVGGTPHLEDTWDGSLLEVGSAVVRVGGPVQRCAATTRDPDTGEVNLQTLRLIGDYRGRQESIFGLGFNFGVYADVVEPGRISVGDVLLTSSAMSLPPMPAPMAWPRYSTVSR